MARHNQALNEVARAMRDQRAAVAAQVAPTPVAELIRRVEEAMAAKMWAGR